MGGAEATKTVSQSRVVLAQHMGMSDSNLAGAVHGGTIMKMVDTAGGLAAMKFSGKPVVTAAIDELSFIERVNLGDLVTVTASVNGVGVTSMEVGVKVETENVLTGEKRHTSTAYLLYVALDPDTGKPATVPRLVTETVEERRRQRQAKARRKARIARRNATVAARMKAEEAARAKKEASQTRRRTKQGEESNLDTAEPAPAQRPGVEERAASASRPATGQQVQPAPESGQDLRRWRSRSPEVRQPALVGATRDSSDASPDLSRWRRKDQ